MVTASNTLLVKNRFLAWLNPWRLGTLFLVSIFLMPVVAITITASGDSDGLWVHLSNTVLPRYVANTLILMVGVSLVTLFFGVTTAWIVVQYDFPGRRIVQWALLLPATIPAYLIAYTYTDFLEYAGPLQVLLRDLFGWDSAIDYWFPEIRSMGGAILVMGAVLYPYVYVITRTAYLLTPISLFEIGRISGCNLFWGVAFPLARPAVVAGLALVMMETISDFGTVEYFSIETLTLGIFNVWLGMNNLTAASQIAAFSFLFVIALVLLERISRARRGYMNTTRRSVSLSPRPVSFGQGTWLALVCSIPIILGFVIPVGVLLNFVVQGYSTSLNSEILSAAWNSLFLGVTVAIMVIVTATFMGLVSSFDRGKAMQRLSALASFGYAFPGTILAIGVVTAGGTIDAWIGSILMQISGVSYQGWLTSGVGLVVFACVVRFQAVGYGSVMAGLGRVPNNMMEASRVLGQGFAQSIRKVMLPLMRLSCVAGGLLVFVDVMKELPMTLLLRPFNYETLATYVYQFAKDELLEEAALPALIIVVSGIIPVILMNAALNQIKNR
jgi:iron(III) transport system permease protein